MPRSFLGPVVDFIGNRIDLVLAVDDHVYSFTQVLAHQAIHVLVRPPLPGAVWVVKIHRYASLLTEFLCMAISLPWVCTMLKRIGCAIPNSLTVSAFKTLAALDGLSAGSLISITRRGCPQCPHLKPHAGPGGRCAPEGRRLIQEMGRHHEQVALLMDNAYEGNGMPELAHCMDFVPIGQWCRSIQSDSSRGSTTGRFTAGAMRSSACSGASKLGGGYLPATTNSM